MNPSVDTIDSVVASDVPAEPQRPVKLIKPKLVGYCRKDDDFLTHVEELVKRGQKDCCIIPMYSKGRTLPDGTVLRTNGTYAIYADPRSTMYMQLKVRAQKESFKRYFS